ncbi:MAG: hypothetical protein ACO1OO_01825 [Flavisolibacter sp.]
MKLHLTTAMLLLSFFCFSQNDWDVREHLKKDTSWFSKPAIVPGTQLEATILPQQKNALPPSFKQKLFFFDPAIDHDSSRVRTLPVDNMPCIVPNTKDIAAMPNAWKGKVRVPFLSQIPNPAQPQIKLEDITK